MYPQIQLSDARAKREEYRALLAKGIDPQEEKNPHPARIWKPLKRYFPFCCRKLL